VPKGAGHPWCYEWKQGGVRSPWKTTASPFPDVPDDSDDDGGADLAGEVFQELWHGPEIMTV
jgi:hypothetical protein